MRPTRGIERAVITLALTVSTGLIGPVAASDNSPTCRGLTATIVGTGLGETLDGTQGPDVIVARGGNDVIDGLGGKDTICGGYGQDQIHGGKGDDAILGGPAHDVIDGGLGSDLLDGTGPGDTTRNHADTVTYEGSDSRVHVSLFESEAIQGEDHDVVRHFDEVHGTAFNDVIIGGVERDDLYGGDGNDTILGRELEDRMFGGDGDDILNGGEQGDMIRTGAGSNRVTDLKGWNRIEEQGDQSTITTGPGRDNISAGNTVTIDSGAGADNVLAKNGAIVAGPGDDEVTVFGSATRVSLGDGTDMVHLPGGGQFSLDGGKGRDRILARTTQDVTIRLGTPGALVSPFRGSLVRFEWVSTGPGDDTLIGSPGNDRLQAVNGDDLLRGRGGNDLLFAGTGSDTVYGGPGSDRCFDVESMIGCELSQ